MLTLGLTTALSGCSAGSDGSTRTQGPDSSQTPEGTSAPTDVPARTAPLMFGAYLGSYSWETYKATFGSYPDVETTYLNADQVLTPDIEKHKQQIDRGISPVITLGYRFGPFTRSQIAQWGPYVQSYYRDFVQGLVMLSTYAADRNNGTKVYFADEHEAVVKIKQRKYSFPGYGSAGVPSVTDSAAAWNAVMRYVAQHAPKVVRVYWYGGSSDGEDAFAGALEPDLIQMATFDPYRWKYNSATATAEALWGDKISHLLSQPWMRNSDGSLKPWGLTEWGTDASHGDPANAVFVRETIDYLDARGAALAVYFSRVDNNDESNNFVFTHGDQPETLQAYREAMGS